MEVACAVIFQNNKVLLLKKASGSYAGKFEFPGGKFDNTLDKTLKDCVQREIKEEIGCNCNVYDLILYTQLDPSIFGYEINLYFYNVKLLDDKITLSDEHTDYIWVTFNETNQINMLDVDHKYIENIKNFFEKK